MSGSHRKQTPIWPFLLVLVCLFVLSLTAPRRWENVARKAPLSNHARFAPGADGALRQPPPILYTETIADSPLDPVIERAPVDEAVESEPVPIVPDRPAPSQEPMEIGPAVANLAPRPELLGADGQISIRVAADLSPRIVMRPEKPPAPPVLDGPALPVDAESALDGREGDVVTMPPAPETSEIEVRPASDQPSRGFRWAEPVQLLERLEALSYREGLSAWSYEVIGLLHELLSTAGPQTPEAAGILRRLADSSQAADDLAAELSGHDSAEMQRTAYALRRRLAIWQPWVTLPQGDAADLAITVPAPERLELCLNEVETAIASDAAGRGWRDYLLFDALLGVASGRGGCEAGATRLLAQRVLARLTASRLSKSQRRFVAEETLERLAGELRSWAAEPIDVEQLLAHAEAYESSTSGADARLLAADLRRLAWSPLVELQDYGRQLEHTYRNANLRFVVSETLLSRLMPPQKPTDEPVRITILGSPTRGRSHTESTVAARLIPDPRRLRFLVEVRGQVVARTRTDSGPATMSTNSRSNFEATREIEVTLAGLEPKQMIASAESTARLREVSTHFDAIPLVGSLVGGYARQQYGERRASAERELERIVAQKAIDNIADMSAARVAELNRQLAERLSGPMERLGIETALIESHTTEDRLTARIRIAGNEQLGAHSPRPRAPSSSLFSAQIHESACNNFLDRLELGGRMVSQRELTDILVQKLNLSQTLLPETIREDVLLQLAADDPVRVRFQEGRIAIELKLDELRAEGNVWRNFVVRAFYRPDPASAQGELMRDGTVQLIGRSLRPKAQVALRGIFSSTFSKERRIPILPDKLAGDPRMEGIRITQWALGDGWIGIALGDIRPGHSPIAAAPDVETVTK